MKICHSMVNAKKKKTFCQRELNDLVCDLISLFKKVVGWTKMIFLIFLQKILKNNFFSITFFQETICLLPWYSRCSLTGGHDILGLLLQVNIAIYNPAEYRMFADNSSLKCVLLHDSNIFSAVPVGSFMHTQETHNGKSKW